jgi:hypothetical protein
MSLSLLLLLVTRDELGRKELPSRAVLELELVVAPPTRF